MSPSEIPPAVARRRLLETSEGTSLAEFGAVEWSLLLAIAGVWGSSFLFIAIGLEAFEPGIITFLRLAFGAAALALVPRARKAPIDPERREALRQDMPRIALLSVLWLALPLHLFPIAQQWIDSSLAGMINGATPLFSALVAILLLRRLPGRRQAWGLAIGFLGVLAVGWPAMQGAWATALGVLLILGASICYGFSTNLAVPLQQRHGALPVLFRAQLVALPLALPYALWSLPGSRFDWGSLLAVLALGVLGTGWAYVAMGTLVGRVGATRGTVAVYFIPVVAVVLGVVFRDERVAPVALAGMVLVIAGAWLTSRRVG